MEITEQSKTLAELGARIRRARQERGLSQEELATPQFTKSYVSAIELGKARPSLKALEFLAQRLGLATSDLMVDPLQGGDDTGFLEEDLAYQLDCARREIDTDNASEGMRLLNEALQSAGTSWPDMETYTRYRFYYLRGLAYVRLGEPVAALLELDLALPLAALIGDNGESAIRVKNLIGGVYYQQDLAAQAVVIHEECERAIAEGIVIDPNLAILIYSNLANDYLALRQPERAVNIYNQALRSLEDVSNLERQSAVYWGLATAYRNMGDLNRAKLYAAGALQIYEALQNQSAVVQMSVNLAKILTARKEYDEAEQHLERARILLTEAGNPFMLGYLYQHMAELSIQQGNLDIAAGYAGRALELGKQAQDQNKSAAENKIRLLHTRVSALSTAGRIAEARADHLSADEYFHQALEVAEQLNSWATAAEIATIYGDLLWARGVYEEAGLYYRKALQKRQFDA